jgi:hypothetical protein
MSPEIMGTDFDTDFSAGFFDNLPGTGMADGKNPFLRGNVFESVYSLNRIENFASILQPYYILIVEILLIRDHH